MREPGRETNPAAGAGTLELPAPTVWPMVLALGITLCLAGFVTSAVISVLGLLLSAMASVGWFREVLPIERHETVMLPAAAQAGEVRLAAAPPSSRRRLVQPLETYSFAAGIEGGLAGGVAMAVPATVFSLMRFHTPWYAVNLLAAGGFVGWANASDAFLGQFHPQGLVAGLGIHLLVSVLVGLLYGAMLPMFPRRPMLTGGLVAPLLWTALVYSVMNSISPILSGRVDWRWFVLSQVAYGLVAGFVVSRRIKMNSPEFQALPFAVRAGLQTDGAPGRRAGQSEDKKR
ncbi:MAG: hypothetical protein ACP5FH_03060 [Terracidiphilus sp.]